MSEKISKTNRAVQQGRPTKLNNETIKIVCEALRAGTFIENAAILAGIYKDTFYDWLKRGEEQDNGPYHQFAQAIQLAHAECELTQLSRINAGESGWQSAAWLLERKWPSRWGQRARLEVSTPPPPRRAPLDFSCLTDEELALAEKLGVQIKDGGLS